MNFRNISSWAIRNPVPPIVLFVALLLAGIVSFMQMDVNDSPDVEFPFVNVSISQPGAAPTELETQVTQRVEAAIRGVNGVEEINSSVREGNSNTFVQFAIGTPVDRATNDVRDAISQIRGDLPDGILEPQVVRAENGSQLAIFAVETSDMTLEQLSWYVDNQVAKQLLSIPGMSSVDRYGGVNREIRVILNPAAIQAQGITASQVNQQLRQINLDSAGGRAEIAGSEQSVRVLGNAKGAQQLGADPDRAPRRPRGQAERRRAGHRQQQRAALDQQAQRPPDFELRRVARQGRVGRHHLRGDREEAARNRKGFGRNDQVQPHLHRSRFDHPAI